MSYDPVTLLIDGDPAVYRVGHSLQRRVYYVEWRDVDPKHLDNPKKDKEYIAKFYNAAARDRFVEIRGLHPDEFATTMINTPSADEHIVYGRVKQTINDIQKHVEEWLNSHGQTIGHTRVFLSGSDNFRADVATIIGYKSSRKDTERPYWYQHIRDYLIKYQAAEVTDGIEADDAVAIIQWRAEAGSTIIATIDKDLLNVRGHHYNYFHKTAQYVTNRQALQTFYCQLLTGDRTDDIAGLWKVGKSHKSLTAVRGMQDESTMYEYVLGLYAENLAKYPAKHGQYGWAYVWHGIELQRCATASLLENARLLWMLTHDDELWTPPGQPSGSIAEFRRRLRR